MPGDYLPKIDFSDERLDNGLRLIMSEDHLAPVVAVNLWYDVGSKHEKPGLTGLAHLFEHMMFQGSTNVAKSEHFKYIESAGGSLNASTWLQRTNYYESGPSNQLELFLWLEADRMGGLLDALGQETLDNQRDVVKNEKRQRYDNAPYGTWWIELIEKLFPEGHPYHHPTIGSMEDLSRVTVDDCREFFSTYYAPNNAVLSIVGDFEPEGARAMVQRYFGGIPAHPAIPAPPPVAIGLDVGGEVRKVIEDKVPLPRIFVGYRAPEAGTREMDALTMAAACLFLGDAGAPNKGARLYRHLVREQIAQDADFWTQDFIGCSVAGGQVTARPDVDLEKLERAFFDVIASLATDPPGDEELARARAGVERQAIQGNFIRAAARADLLSKYATVFGDPDRANDALPRLLSVTSEEIANVARDVFREDSRVVLTYIPERA
ncbi:MAG TPA: pitrilysin family protein [Actinomycetota bacterium]|nr:pitrilysin family protein [Actinomycetota bacterium]